ncbi:hypothetical protein IE81DRAFT_322287 [Ceraceosorus guamensis]|uniref:Uncharacterized protein n=1 Tax=Ceraceosorus guamensis TaxID=1522189 RepID=A0A316W128_9BASI|nr:hypothetical protein IE81DRAFT_322287 [Ceraceosorus guamensis]PWN43637.1 hypothetical protein IE81DRAFT_322287 [Ceraceosorus guamensis]
MYCKTCLAVASNTLLLARRDSASVVSLVPADSEEISACTTGSSSSKRKPLLQYARLLVCSRTQKLGHRGLSSQCAPRVLDLSLKAVVSAETLS